jgi:hypothetical protein
MNRRMASVLYSLFLLFALINIVSATDESFADQFLGSPLLVLTAIIVIDIIALVYRKIRK